MRWECPQRPTRIELISVPERSCVVGVDLPHDRTDEPEPDRIVTFTFETILYGDPQAVRTLTRYLFFVPAQAPNAKLATDLGADECERIDHDELRCRKGPVVLRLGATIDRGARRPYRVEMPDYPGIATYDMQTLFADAVFALVMKHVLERFPG